MKIHRAFIGALVLPAACVLADVSLDSRGCPCLEGWVCENGVCVTESARVDGGGGASPDAADGAAPNFRCPPATGGPPLVPTDTFCIDATEVTVAHYRAFLEAGVPPPGDGNPLCADNTDYAPGIDYGDAGEPPPDVAVYVDWCDAIAFCKWTGKRLCGAIDGGSLDFDAAADRTQNQWLHACTGPLGNVYPYGNDPRPDACAPAVGVGPSDKYAPYSMLPPVTGFPQCEGGYSGLFGMTGGTNEWTDIRVNASGAVAFGAAGQCRGASQSLGTLKFPFRCCAP